MKKLINVLDNLFKGICPTTECRGHCCRRCASGGYGLSGYFKVEYGFYYKPQLLPSEVHRNMTALKKKYGYHEYYGFLNPKKGCRLPREVRSITCLEYMCSGSQEELVKRLKLSGIGELRAKISRICRSIEILKMKNRLLI